MPTISLNLCRNLRLLNKSFIWEQYYFKKRLVLIKCQQGYILCILIIPPPLLRFMFFHDK